MQSFSYQVKSELCRVPVQRVCCARAEEMTVLLEKEKECRMPAKT